MSVEPYSRKSEAENLNLERLLGKRAQKGGCRTDQGLRGYLRGAVEGGQTSKRGRKQSLFLEKKDQA